MARQDALKGLGTSIPSPIPIRALVDTGASCTCVDPTILAQLGLTPTGSLPMMTPSTGTQPHMADQYDIGLIIPGATQGDPPYIIETLPVVCSVLAVQGIHALIGRDILAGCFMAYNGTAGFFTLAF